MLRYLLSLLLLLAIITSLPVQPQDASTPTEKQSLQMFNLIRNEYYRPLSAEELLRGMIEGFAQVLDDRYICYYPPRQYRDFQQELNAKYQGIGAIVKLDDSKLRVVAPLAGSPSEKAGLKAGDVIIAIDGDKKLGNDLGELVRRLRGPQGSKVSLQIQRRVTGELLAISVVRQEFSYSGYTYQQLAPGVGHLKFRFFHKGIAVQLKEILSKAQQDTGALIVDLRGCHGGVLEEVIATADLFLPPGPVMQLQMRQGKEIKEVKTPAIYNKALLVLIDNKTVSGAELLAGALRDRGQATLIGATTFGKGSVQKVFALENGGGMKLTIAHYFTPNGHKVEKTGITPDITITDEARQLQIAKSLVQAMLRNQKQRQKNSQTGAGKK